MKRETKLAYLPILLLTVPLVLANACAGLPEKASSGADSSKGEQKEGLHGPETTSHHHGQGHKKGGEGMHHDFSDAERWHRIFEGEDRDEWQKPEEVIRLMELEPGMKVADLGAGTGYFVQHLAAAVGPEGKVFALDPEENLVQFMEQRAQKEGWGQVEVRHIPFDRPGLEEASVDRILIVNTWHHIDHRGAYAEALKKALAPGGRIYVVDFTRESPHGPSVEHRLPAAAVIEELGQGGLAAEIAESPLPWQYVVVAQGTSP